MARISLRPAQWRSLLALAAVALLTGPTLSLADDLVAATLPGSRSALVGQTVTVFATVINTSGRALSGCTVTLTGLPVTLDYTTTNPSTNATNGTADTPFSLAVGASQTLVLSMTPTASFDPIDAPLAYACADANPAPSIQGLSTVLISASTTQPPDVIALIATASDDGIIHVPGIGQTAAFAVATANVGADATFTVVADAGLLNPPPVSVVLCQTDPGTGQCLAAPAPTVSLDIPTNATPTFAAFITSNVNVPFSPATTRVFVRFLDADNAERGATSLAVTDNATVATAPTGGGIYQGTVSVTGGSGIGSAETVTLIVGENGQFAGVTAASMSSPNDALFSGGLAANTSLAFVTGGATLTAAPGFTLQDGGTGTTLALNGTLSPGGYIAGLLSTANGETGTIEAAFNAGLYDRAVTVDQFSGVWNLRDDASTAIGTFTFDDAGNFTGVGTGPNNNGCAYSGKISPVDPNFNAESTLLAITNCSTTGNYSGLAAFTDFQATDDTVIFGLVSADHTLAFTSSLTRF